MIRSSLLLLLASCCPLPGAPAPQLLDPPALFSAPTGAGTESSIHYRGQAAKDGRIDLTATNGFFDRCFVASDPGPMVEGDDSLIGASFGHLANGPDKTGSARWHLWFPVAGRFTASVWMEVPAADDGRKWTARFGGKEEVLVSRYREGDGAVRTDLSFEVTDPGKHTFSLEPPGETHATRLHLIRLVGPAVGPARLLRVRWRPAAVHQRFEAPPECKAPDLWIFETRSVSETSSYSPLTTPFGYYGTSFKAGGRVREGGSFNFSMWLAGRGAEKAPPIEKMPRILATGLPGATFSWFSHEGTGVKLRDAVAYPEGADRTIQAMRVEFADGLWTYYGYFYDESAERWRLFAAGRQPPKRGRAPDPTRGLLRSTGSFCEIPGPPQRERSGDLVRLIKRRGWFIDRDGSPHLAVMAERRMKPGPPDSKRTWYMEDYPTQGWMGMATGGMELYPARATATAPAHQVPLPGYLAPEKLKQLFELPVHFGETRIVEVSATGATFEFDLPKTGPNARARLYYGPVDALTYPATSIRGESEALRDMFRPERTWAYQTPLVAISGEKVQFTLSDLKPGKRYYSRLWVEHDEGKSWRFSSGNFETRHVRDSSSRAGTNSESSEQD